VRACKGCSARYHRGVRSGGDRVPNAHTRRARYPKVAHAHHSGDAPTGIFIYFSLRNQETLRRCAHSLSHMCAASVDEINFYCRCRWSAVFAACVWCFDGAARRQNTREDEKCCPRPMIDAITGAPIRRADRSTADIFRYLFCSWIINVFTGVYLELRWDRRFQFSQPR